MSSYRLCSWEIWALHHGQRHCSSAVSLQATDVYLCQTNLDKPQTTSVNAPQTAESPFESGVQAWSSNVHQWHVITSRTPPEWNSNRYAWLPDLSSSWRRKIPTGGRRNKSGRSNLPQKPTPRANSPLKKLTRMPPCKHWWHWSQLVGLMTNCRAPLCTRVLALKGWSVHSKWPSLSWYKNHYSPHHENRDYSSSSSLPPWNSVHNKHCKKHVLAKKDRRLIRRSPKVWNLSTDETCALKGTYDDLSGSNLTLVNRCYWLFRVW